MSLSTLHQRLRGVLQIYSSSSRVLLQSRIINISPRQCIELVRINAHRGLCTAPKQSSFVGRKTLEDFHRKDGVPKSFTLIYRSNFANYFLGSQIFVVLSIAASLTTLLLSLLQSQANKEMRDKAIDTKKEDIQKEVEDDREQKRVLLAKVMGPDGSEEGDLKTIRPSIADLVEKDLGIFAVMMFCLVTITLCMNRLLCTIPVRIYVGKQVSVNSLRFGFQTLYFIL
jgi:hypothetical protein